MSELPLIDVADLDSDPEAIARFRDLLRTATHEVGFFHVRHRIPAEEARDLGQVNRVVSRAGFPAAVTSYADRPLTPAPVPPHHPRTPQQGAQE